jgi:adenylate cyclase class 2
MKTEFEATYIDIDVEKIKGALVANGATLTKEEFLQRRCVFRLPKETATEHNFLRVRDEGGKVSLTLKDVTGKTIDGQKEIQFNIDDFEGAVSLLSTIGCEKKSFQESRREVWNIGDTEIVFDTWPFLETYIEIEGPDEEAVKEVSAKLGMDYGNALFCTVDEIYKMKYGVSIEELPKDQKSSIVFDGPNPFF